MDEPWRGDVVAFCEDAVGSPLRSVLAYERAGHGVESDVWYVREDVRAEYGDELEAAARAVMEEVALEGIGTDWLAHVHHFGDVVSTVRVFESAIVVQCWLGEATGLSVSVEPGADVDYEAFARELCALAAG